MAKKSSAAAILAANLQALQRVAGAELKSQPKIASKAKIGQRTVGRALKGEVSTTIGSLEGLASAFGVEPWQLLHPDGAMLAAQQRLTLDEERALKEVEDKIAALSKPAKAKLLADQPELFGSASGIVKEIIEADPYPSAGLERKGWSAAGKPVSRKTE